MHDASGHPSNAGDGIFGPLVMAPAAVPGKIGDMNKSVVPTSDGGIIVVGAGKIAKYDKDLNLIKEIE